MSDIDLIEKDFDEVETTIDDSVEDIDEKGGKRRTTKQQLKVRRAIEDRLNEKRFRKEVDYLIEEE